MWEDVAHYDFINAIRNRKFLKQFAEIGINIYLSYITNGYLILRSKKEAIIIYATLNSELKLENIDFFLENLKIEANTLYKLNVYGAIATKHLNNSTKIYAEAKGLFTIENDINGLPSIANPKSFTPKLF